MNIDHLLRDLDPAPTEPTPEQWRRADALLERIALDTGAPERRRFPRATRDRNGMRRVGALLAAGAAVAAVATAVHGLLPQSAAVASWTPEPEAVSAADLAVAVHACRQQLAGAPDAADIPLSISERRGDIVALLFSQASLGTASSCVVDLPKGAVEPREVAAGSGGGSGAAPTAPDNGFLTGTQAQFSIGGDVLSVVSGSVGADVASITVHGAGVVADATITDGRFAAWIPGAAVTNMGAPTGDGGPQSALSFDLTLEDGTVITDATPDGPHPVGSVEAPN